MKLLRVQKNSFYDLLENTGLLPSSFLIIDPDAFANHETIIRYIHSNFQFSISLQSNDQFMVVKYSPGKNKLYKESWCKTWDEVESNFITWAISLFSEVNEIDKWERLKNELNQINISFSDETDKFSAYEYDDLKSKMLVLKMGIKQLDLLPEQIKTLENKIDHLT